MSIFVNILGMKKAFIFFLIITLLISLTFINNNVSFAADSIIEPVIFSQASLNLTNPKDLSFESDNFLVLSSDTDPNFRYITTYNSDISNKDEASKENETLEEIGPSYLASFNNSYFYATHDEVFCDDEKINQSFNDIQDLTKSYKSLFLIDYNEGTNSTKIYKYNKDTKRFDTYKTYNEKITKFCYNEVSKKSFTYDDENVYIENSILREISNVADIVCDFEGNLFIFQNDGTTNKIYKYTYNSDYENYETFVIDFNLPFTINIISAVIVQENGNVALLIGYDDGSSVFSYRVFVIGNSYVDLNVITAKDSPDVNFSQMDIFNLSKTFENFYVAKITDYPSNRLYPAEIYHNSASVVINDQISEIDINETVLVFKTADKFSYILYKGIPAIVYNNSLSPANQGEIFENGKIMLNNTKVYKYPSSFNIKPSNNLLSFQIDNLKKDTEVKVLYTVKMADAVFAYIEYNGKSGYVNAAEILDAGFKIVLENPIFGFVDSSGKVSLFESKDLNSKVVALLDNGQEFEILESGTDFYYIKVGIDIGYIQSKYVLESGLTNMQKLGLYIGLSIAALLILAFFTRHIIKSRKQKI